MVLRKSVLLPGTYYFSGNEAITEGAIAAGCNFYGGYPITPSTEVMERISVRFIDTGGVFMQMEDELGAIGSIIGASWAGAKAMTATSGPGFSLMQESIGYAVMTETPIVVVNVQRAGPSTGQSVRVASGDIMQAKWGSHGDYEIIAFCPWYRVPVFLLTEEAIGHLRERIEVSRNIEIFNRKKKPGAAPFGTKESDGIPPMPTFGEGEKLLITGSTHDEYGIRRVSSPSAQAKLTSRLNNKILNNQDKIIDYEVHYIDDADLLVIAYGFTARSALFAIEELRQRGKKIGMLRLKTLWPFADKIVKDIGGKVEKIFVPEMNRGQIAGEVMKCVCGDVVSYSQTNGEVIHPETIAEQIRRLC